MDVAGSRGRHIAIAGAGIAGLTAAIAFAAKGFPVRLFERAAKPQEVGAGLQLSPNATRILSRLGVPDRLHAATIRPDAVVLRRASDLREIARVVLGDEALRRWKSPYLVLHRADLHAGLLSVAARLPGVEIVTSATVMDAAFHPQGVTVAVEQDGRTRELDALLLVGADGVWSRARRIVGGAESRFSGKIAWRTTLRADSEAMAGISDYLRRDCVSAFLHPKAHLVSYPIRGGSAVNIAAFTRGALAGTGWSRDSDGAPLRAALADAALPLASLLDSVTQWTMWPLHTVDPASPWTKSGGAVLIGDAAHAMTPFAAQGAASAIEDAYVLAATVADQPGDIAAALARYERIRRPRVAAVVRRGAFNAFTWHAAGPVAAVRDMVLATRSTDRLAADFDWLYGWDADQALAPAPALRAGR